MGNCIYNSQIKTRASIFLLIGCITDVIFGFAFLTALAARQANSFGAAFLFLLLLAAGVGMTVYGAALNGKWKRALRYAAFLTNFPISLYALSAQLGMDPTYLANDLEDLLLSNVLLGLYLDRKNGLICCHEATLMPGMPPFARYQSPMPPQANNGMWNSPAGVPGYNAAVPPAGVPGYNAAVPPAGVPGYNAAVPPAGVPGYNAAVPPAGVPGYNAAVPPAGVPGYNAAVPPTDVPGYQKSFTAGTPRTSESFLSPLPLVKLVPWAAVIVLLILFWPVGLFLLIKRLFPPKTPERGRAVNFIFAGGLLLFLGLALILLADAAQYQYLLYRILDSKTYFHISSFLIGYGIVLLLPAIPLLIVGLVQYHKSTRFLRYVDLVAGQGVTRLDQLSARTQTPAARVFQDLQAMLSRGYFPGTQMDPQTGNLMFPVFDAAPAVPPQEEPAACEPEQEAHAMQEEEERQPPDAEEEVPAYSVPCPRCGTENYLQTEEDRFCKNCGLSLRN